MSIAQKFLHVTMYVQSHVNELSLHKNSDGLNKRLLIFCLCRGPDARKYIHIEYRLLKFLHEALNALFVFIVYLYYIVSP